MSESYTSIDFLSFLSEIFGKTIVFGFLKDGVLELKASNDLINFAVNFTRKKDSGGCHLCEITYNFIKPNGKPNFKERTMDFPSWLGVLDFNNKNRKEIMIMGESVPGKLKNKIKVGVAFSLGIYINKLSDIDNVSDRTYAFWQRLKTIFNKRKDDWVKKLYITDIGKCNAAGNPLIHNTCGLKYTLRELKYIHPKLLIFLGHSSHDGFIPILQIQDDITIEPIELLNNRKYPYYQNKNMCSGIINFNSNKLESIYYITIPHTASKNKIYDQDTFWLDLHKELNSKFPQFF